MTTLNIYTIGHSNHRLVDFIEMLAAHAIDLIADVRTVPRSRHNPQFNIDALPTSLSAQGVDYCHLGDLGGLRRARKDSQNDGWKNASFRGFADYMQTDGFQRGLAKLIELAGERRTAVMCAESLPWRCHRSLIADALAVRGIAVLHILSRTSVKEHKLTSFAAVSGTTVTYPREPRSS
jgi:uncharacterized protein (DUF488 family)